MEDIATCTQFSFELQRVNRKPLIQLCWLFSLVLAPTLRMDFFSRGYTALRGERGQPQSADETIEKLADCLETATLLEDRRAGVLSLKGLVRDWPEVNKDSAIDISNANICYLPIGSWK